MNRVIMIGFDYNGAMHYALVTVKLFDGHLAYHIMPSDADLKELLQEQHIVRQVNDCLEYCAMNQIQRRLIESICNSLGNLLSLQVREVAHRANE